MKGKIIRVADEYDAIVSKRQYKSHIGISDTLKILIENANNGKNNPLIVRKLLKVVIEDIEYEIYLTQSYVENLNEEIKRLNAIADRFKYKPTKAKMALSKLKQIERMVKIEEPNKYDLKSFKTNFEINKESGKKCFKCRKFGNWI